MRLTFSWSLVSLVLVTVVAQTINNIHNDDTSIDDDRDKLSGDVGPTPHCNQAARNESHRPSDCRAQPNNRKQGTAAPLKKTSAIGSASHQTRSTEDSTYDLWPFVQDFTMAHSLPMASKGTASREVSPLTLMKSNIPSTLTVTQGSFEATALPRSLYEIKDVDRFSEAMLELVTSNSKARRTVANPQFGEMAVQSIMGAGLFDPTNAIFSAITGTDDAVVWRIIGSGMADPVPDVLLTVGGRKAAVIEVKTTTALGDDEIQEILENLATYTMEDRKDVVKKDKEATEPQDSKDDEGHGMEEDNVAEEENDRKAIGKTGQRGTVVMDVMTLVDSTSPQGRRRRRKKSTKTMEQIIAQMYAHDVPIGALTNLDTWFILEKKGKDSIEVTKLDGFANDRSNALDIVLAMTYRVAEDEVAKHL